MEIDEEKRRIEELWKLPKEELISMILQWERIYEAEKEEIVEEELTEIEKKIYRFLKEIYRKKKIPQKITLKEIWSHLNQLKNKGYKLPKPS